jgi:hypothetical protein
MRPKFWTGDTIALRFALTIASAIIVALALIGAVVQFAGLWGRPLMREAALLERANDIVRMVEVAPERNRQALADTVVNATFRLDWYSATSTVAVMLDAAGSLRPLRDLPQFESGGHRRRLVYFTSANQGPLLSGLRPGRTDHPMPISSGSNSRMPVGSSSWRPTGSGALNPRSGSGFR